MRNKLLLSLLLPLSMLVIASCSVVMATQQPGRKDLSVLSKGVERPRVIAELGSPLSTETMKDGCKADTFAFVQGYSTGAKAGRAVFHGVADFFTLGLWEVVGTPGEAIFSGSKVKAKVEYDKDDRVTNVAVFEGKEKVDEGVVPSASKAAPETPPIQKEAPEAPPMQKAPETPPML